MPDNIIQEAEMNEYHRTIVNFLRDYGAKDVQIIGGGRHPHIDFMFKDKKFNLAVHQNGEAHTDAAINKTKELRSLLGDPLPTTSSEPRKLEDMTPATSDAPRYRGALAMYRTGSQYNNISIRIFPPDEILKWIAKRPMEVQRLAHDTWLLKVSYASGKPLHQDGKQWIVSSGSSMTKGYDAPIGKSPAEFIKVGDDVTVRLLLDQVKAINEVFSKRASNPHMDVVTKRTPALITPTSAEAWAASRNAPAESVPALSPENAWTADHAIKWVEPPLTPRAVLEAIAQVERTTVYRLVRLKDDKGWAWQAPLIKLEDPE